MIGKRPSTSEYFAPHGIVVMMDVAKFTTMPENDQLRVYRELWDVVRANNLVKDLTEQAIVKSAGDGVMVAFPCVRVQVQEEAVVAFCEQVAAHMEGNHIEAPIRVGIHRGPFNVVRDPASDRPDALGRAPNHCQRVMSVADGSSIIASEEFVGTWAGRLSQSVYHKFSKPILVAVKHDEEIRVRIFHRPGRDWPIVPTKIRRLLEIERGLLAVLASVEDDFVRLLQKNQPMLTPDRLSTRVSVFALRENSALAEIPHIDDGDPIVGILVPTKFRYHRAGIQPAAGSTWYPVTKPPKGLWATAVTTGVPQAVHGLPDPDESVDEYIRAVTRRTELSEFVCKDFGRRARAYLTWPFGNAFPGEPPVWSGCVCIDTDDPLSDVSDESLVRIGRELLESHSRQIHWLWNARGL